MEPQAKSQPSRAERRRNPGVTAETRRSPAWMVAGLSAAGLAVSGYLTWVKLHGGQALLCAAGGGCDRVQASPYGILLGLPTALWGAGLYLVIGVLGLLGLTARRWLGAFLLVAGGVAFSVYLTYLALFVVGATCGYCLASASILVVLLAGLVAGRPPASALGALGSPSRLLALGGLASVATVLVAVALFRASPEASATSSTPYHSALANHLARTGAVMYGAYW